MTTSTRKQLRTQRKPRKRLGNFRAPLLRCMPIRTKPSLSVPPKHPRRPAYSQRHENLLGACWETAGLGIKVQVIPSRTRDQRKTKAFTSGKLTLTYLLDPNQYGLLPECWRIRRIPFHDSRGKQDSGTWVSERMQWVMVR